MLVSITAINAPMINAFRLISFLIFWVDNAFKTRKSMGGLKHEKCQKL
jgi:hypothetical protein